MITKHASRSTTLIGDLRLFNSARSAWGYLLEILNPHKILLPANIGHTDREGSGIMDPVLNQQVPFDFYPLTRQLEPDINRIEQHLKTRTIDLLLVIHYFGYVRANLRVVQGLCQHYNVVWVKDCAHAFQLGVPQPTAGIWGQYSFYSIHKHLPTQHGGILRSNLHAPALPMITNQHS